MSYYYGQPITYGPLSAPQLFTGDILRYSYGDGLTDDDLADASADITALAFHSRQAEIDFESEITKGSTNFLDLSDGALITVASIAGGTILVSEAVERWAVGQKKRASIKATHFIDLVHAGTTGKAGTALDAFTPDQTGMGIVQPGGEVIYGTYGFTHDAGVIHELTVTQRYRLIPNDPSPDGKILGAAATRYKRTISMSLLALGDLPELGSELVITGAPAHLSKYRITRSEKVLEREKGKMYSVAASWIPAFGTGSGGGEEGGAP